MKAAVILGAGFSKNSGIPVQSEIPGFLITSTGGDKFEDAVSSIIRRYMEDIFGYDGSGSYPNLEDMFTCLDLSTNSGHHLGKNYSPPRLRALRRFLVYKVFHLLENRFVWSDHVKFLMKKLENTFSDVGYVVLNWDTVLERYLLSLFPQRSIDYCCKSERWNKDEGPQDGKRIRVAKIHGSCNWLYCDNCRTLFHDLDNEVSLRARAGFQISDFEFFDEFEGSRGIKATEYPEKCRICGDDASSHIATFSYRKSFRANSFPDIWDETEEMLAGSDKWVFIGYSLPEPDYEFKHLLKISQLKLKHRRPGKPGIDVVLLNSDDTISKYESFFGSSIENIFQGGISEYLNVDRLHHCRHL